MPTSSAARPTATLADLAAARAVGELFLEVANDSRVRASTATEGVDDVRR